MFGVASLSTTDKSHVLPQNLANHSPTISLFLLSFDIRLLLIELTEPHHCDACRNLAHRAEGRAPFVAFQFGFRLVPQDRRPRWLSWFDQAQVQCRDSIVETHFRRDPAIL